MIRVALGRLGGSLLRRGPFDGERRVGGHEAAVVVRDKLRGSPQRILGVDQRAVVARRAHLAFLRAPQVEHQGDALPPRGDERVPAPGGPPLVEEQVRLGVLEDIRHCGHDDGPERGCAREQQAEQLRQTPARDEVRAVLGIGHAAPPRGVYHRRAERDGHRLVRHRHRVDKASKDGDAVRAAQDRAVIRPPVAQRGEERGGREFHRVLARHRVNPGRWIRFGKRRSSARVRRLASRHRRAVHAGVEGRIHGPRDGAGRVRTFEAVQRGLHGTRGAETLRGGLVHVGHGHEEVKRRRPLVVIRGRVRAGYRHGRLARTLRRELLRAERREPGHEAKRLRLQVPQLLPGPPRSRALNRRRRARQRLHKGQQARDELPSRQLRARLVVRELGEELPRQSLHLEILRGRRVRQRVHDAVDAAVQSDGGRRAELRLRRSVSRGVAQAGDPQGCPGPAILREHARGDEQLVPELLVRFPVPLAERRADEPGERGAKTLGSRPRRGSQLR